LNRATDFKIMKNSGLNLHVFRRLLPLVCLLALARLLHAAPVFQSVRSLGLIIPAGPLIQGSDGALYGTTRSGGSRGYGSVFRLTAGGGLSTVYSFIGGDEGVMPDGGLVQMPDGRFYGTTTVGGIQGGGSIFRVTTNGALTVLYSFAGDLNAPRPERLVLGKDGDLYGTLELGGNAQMGSIYRLDSNGEFRTIYSFSGGSDGYYPSRIVQASDGNLYGTTSFGGKNDGGYGTVFRLTTDGRLTVLYRFSGGKDGGDPMTGGLIEAADGNLYGATSNFSPPGSDTVPATVFKITLSGVLTTLASLGAQGFPSALVQVADGSFYGTMSGGWGAYSSYGSVFRITTNGTLITLHSFAGLTDGAGPLDALTLASGGSLYGMSWVWGGFNPAAFRITTDGTFSVLQTFRGTESSDSPRSALVQASDGNLYGTTPFGGVDQFGSVYRIAPNGDLTDLHFFTYDEYGSSNPWAGLVQASDGNLYGTTSKPFFPDGDPGKVFRITTDGITTTLYSFSGGSDGANPSGSLIQASDGALYGTTQNGADHDQGTIFRIGLDGSFTTLQAFSGASDGANPVAGLIQADDSYLYGTASAGGDQGQGTVFRISTNAFFTTLYSFSGGTDGAKPVSSLAQASDGHLYGTTFLGGSHGFGSIFRLSKGGILSTLYSFNGSSDGAYPSIGLIQARDGNLYGGAGGGTTGTGTLFQITTNGAFAVLYTFSGWDGDSPCGLTQVQDGSLWGTTAFGGAGDLGTIFRLLLAPPLIAVASSQVPNHSFAFGFPTLSGQSYTVQQTDKLSPANWNLYTNFIGDGFKAGWTLPIGHERARFFRIQQP
jgi:uncharacterized repeat protein (TIGR03803 family)